MNLKWKLINSVGRVAQWTALDRTLHNLVGNKDSLTVLTYHRIARADEYCHLDPTLISATPTGFAKQLDYLSDRFNFVSGEQLLAATRGEGRLPTHPLLITFDDGYEDFAKNAWPELEQRSIPAVLFVSTHNVEHQLSFWWDRLHNLLTTLGKRTIRVAALGSDPLPASEHATKKRLKTWLKSLRPDIALDWVEKQCAVAHVPNFDCSLLDWAALSELAQAGVAVCPHTQTHPIITNLKSAQIEQEITGSYADVERRIGASLPLFAYPSGHVDERVREICSQTNIELAFTTKFGVNNIEDADPWFLRRINVSAKSEPALLGLQISAGRALT